jgi:hypothetical protein
MARAAAISSAHAGEKKSGVKSALQGQQIARDIHAGFRTHDDKIYAVNAPLAEVCEGSLGYAPAKLSFGGTQISTHSKSK